MPPCTTIRRITANFKMKNTQNCQKIELYGSPTTKGLKKLYSSRRIGGAEIGSQERTWYGSSEPAVTRQQQQPAEQAVLHSHVVAKHQGNTL